MIGLFTTALFLAHLAMQIPGGRASDRFGARRAALAGLAVISFGNALALVASDPAFAIVVRALVGVGTGVAFVSGSAYIRTSGGSAFAQGLYGGAGLAGGGLALEVVPWVEDGIGWRAPYATALLASAVAFPILLAGPRDRPWRRPLREHGVPAGLFRDRRLHRLAALYAASLGISIVIANWVVTLLEHHGVAKGSAAAAGGLTLLLGIVTRPLGGWMLRTHPAAIRLAVGSSLAAGAIGTFAIAVAEPLPLVATGAVLVGLAAGIPFAPAFTGAAQMRPDAPAASVGLVNSAASLVIVAGTPLIGWTFSLPGDGRLGFLVLALLWSGSMLALPGARELGAGTGMPMHR